MLSKRMIVSRRRFFVLALFIFLSASLFAAPKSTEAAFGVSPPFIEATSLRKGSRYVQTIYLVRDQADVDLPIKAELEVSDRVRSWFLIYGGKPITIPKGVRQFPVEVVIRVPKDAGLGVYTGSILFATDPKRSGQVSIALGVQVSINLTIGTGIMRDYQVRDVQLLDIEQGWDPRVYVRFENRGNIAEKTFDGAAYELFDQFGAVRLAYIQKNDGFPEVEPFSTDEFTTDFPIDLRLGLGQYWGNVVFYKDEKSVFSKKAFFQVLKPGSLSSPTAALLANLKANWRYYGAALLIFAVGWFWRSRRAKRLVARRS